jgi:DNA-binding CsgD family transcriptional regulator
MRWLCNAGHVAMPAAENVEEWELLARGVRYEAIYERALLEEPGMVDNVARSIRAGEQARATGTLPVRMVIADRSIAICPLMHGGSGGSLGEPTAAVVRGSSLLDALIALFESQWAAASPLHVTDSGELADFGGSPRPGANVADDERYLLSLVVAGVADKAIASQLRVSQRTVQRRIRVLMQRAGAATRTQLVWQAARRGAVMRGGGSHEIRARTPSYGLLPGSDQPTTVPAPSHSLTPIPPKASTSAETVALSASGRHSLSRTKPGSRIRSPSKRVTISLGSRT